MIAPLLCRLLLIAWGTPPVFADEPKLEGTWVCIKGERDGAAHDNPVGSKVTFADGMVTIVPKKDGEPTHKGKYEVDDAKSPRQITLIPEDNNGNASERKMLGVYEIKDGKLTICLGDPQDGERPDELKAGSGSKRLLMVFEREKE